MMFRSRLSMVINEGLFCVKYILVLGIFIAFLFVKNDTFNEYSIASKYISIIFMIIQVSYFLVSLSFSLIYFILRESNWLQDTMRDKLHVLPF